MKNLIAKLTLTWTFLLLLFSCQKKENDIESFNHKNNITTQDFEITCIFAASEINKYYLYSSSQSVFNGSKFPRILSKVSSNIKKNCSQNAASEIILEYLKSIDFENDSRALKLDDNFKSRLISGIQNSTNSKYESLKNVVETIYEISYYKANIEKNISFNSLIGQRLSMVNGDTIEIGVNKKHPFPTDFFINQKASKEHIEELNTTWLQGGNRPNIINQASLKIETTIGTFQNNIFIKTIKE